jgi:chromosome segregation ATPase
MKMKRKKLEDLNERLENAKKNYDNKQSALEMFNQKANQLVQSIKENQAQLQNFEHEHELQLLRPLQVEEGIDQFEKMIKELQDKIVNETEKSKQLKDKIEQLERERDSLNVTVLKEQKSGLEEKVSLIYFLSCFHTHTHTHFYYYYYYYYYYCYELLFSLMFKIWESAIVCKTRDLKVMFF